MNNKLNTQFAQTGEQFFNFDGNSQVVHEILPAFVYVLKFHSKLGFYLERTLDFTLPAKMYGDLGKTGDRVLATFEARASNTGVLLAGNKGSGKSLLAKSICAKAKAKGLPTILINSPFGGEQFNTFMASIVQPCVIFVDEFEKVYIEEPGGNQARRRDEDEDTSSNHGSQNGLLTLLDGTYGGNKLFLFTCNDMWKVSTHMRNRPGRIFYFKKFDGLDEEFIREYCVDNLKDKDTAIQQEIVDLAMSLSSFSFDMLQALVWEMNQYGERAEEAVKLLNVKSMYDDQTTYSVSVLHRGKPIEFYGDTKIATNLMGRHPYHFYFSSKQRLEEYGDEDNHKVTLDKGSLLSAKPSMGKYEFENPQDKGLVVSLTAIRESASYMAF